MSDAPIVVRLQPMPGAFLRGSVDGAPSIEAIGSTATRVLQRIGRELDRLGAIDGDDPRALPVVASSDPVPIPDPFRCAGGYEVVRDRGVCAERFRLVNAPPPGTSAECAGWAAARVEAARCVGCRLGAAVAGAT